MHYNSLIEIVDSIKTWLRGFWAISSGILLLLIVCFLAWAHASISTKAALELKNINRMMQNATELIDAPYDLGTLGYSRFTITRSGIISKGSPSWLEGVNLSATPLFTTLTSLPRDVSAGSKTKLPYFLFFYPDLVEKTLAPHLVFIEDDHFKVVSMQHFGRLYSGVDAPDILMTDATGNIIYTPKLNRPGSYGSAAKIGSAYHASSGIVVDSGRLLYANVETLPSMNPIRITVYEDVSSISFTLVLLVILFLLSLFFVNTRIQSVFSSLFRLRDEFDQITEVTMIAGDDRHQVLGNNLQSQANLKGLTRSLAKLKDLKLQFQENIRTVSLIEWLISSCLKLVAGINEREERFNLLTSLSPVGVFHADTSGTIQYVNKRLCDILGVTEDRLLGNRLENFLHPEDRQKYMKARDDVEHVIKQQLRCVRADGKELFVVCEEVFQVNGVKQFTGTIGAVTDITEMKRTEEALQESEARWQFALDGSGNGVWDWNIETDEAFFSPQWASILGYQPDEISHQVDEWTSRVHPDDAEDANRAVNIHLANESPFYQSEHRLLCKDGHYKWVLDRGKVIEWTSDGKPKRMIGTHSDITERKSNEAKIHHLAYHDSLTGLPNRAYLQEELFFLLSQLKRSNQNTALLFLDIDHFKMVNDSMGHLVGDQMLQQVATRLKNSVRDEDFLVRLGGDEFVILLGNPAESIESVYKRARKVAENVLEAFKEPFEFFGQTLVSGSSIGIVVFPEDGKSVKEVLQHADTAMYQAKKDGRNTLHFYRQELATAIKRRLYIENGLRTAIAENELTLFYQPKVSLTSDKIVGVEALVRWNHKGESISPAEFIPIAEECGLILSLGPWVMETACRQMAHWKTVAMFESLKYMAINVSPHQFTQPGFVDQVNQIVDAANINPGWIELELTEGVFMNNVEKSKTKMIELKKRGFRFAVDDFGTGYSSLAYLKQLPVDILKVDQAFVRDLAVDPNDASIVRTVLAMAHGLGMEAVAEGVESAQHIDFLKKEGCKYFQGYYFSKPLSVADFEKLMVEHEPTSPEA